ncbi:MAG: restriction endonuclease subunit S [bacterium]|nr:restriction endonuclease subunit S [bacterium]
METTIGDVALGIFDGPHATPKKTTNGPIFLGISSLVNGRLDLTDTAHLSEEDFRKWTRRVTPQENDIVFSYETRLGEAARIPVGLRCCLGRRMALIRPNPSKIDARFLLYLYLSPEFQDVIRARTVHGSTVDRIPLLEIPRFPIRLPPLPEQRAIASILGSLDDKIELNRRMNETLESIARSIFKSWFVDFDPVRAKMDGRKPPGMDDATAALFPDSLEHVDGELIPIGWHAARVSDLAEVNYGKNLPAKKLLTSGVPVYGAAGLVGFYSEAMFLEPVTLVTSRGSGSGTVHQTFGPSFVTNNSFTVVSRESWLGRHYLRHALLNADILSLVTGSAQPQLTVTNFSYLKMLKPDEGAVRFFHAIVDRLWTRANINRTESETLAALRDTLLPKLLSGELRVGNAQELIDQLPSDTSSSNRELEAEAASGTKVI